MRFTMSPNVAVRTSDAGAAVEFYREVLGFSSRRRGGDVDELDAEPLTLFVIHDDEVSGPVHELFVDDVEAARDRLVAAGCEVVRWHGKGADCYVRDPFGVVFNLWESS